MAVWRAPEVTPTPASQFPARDARLKEFMTRALKRQRIEEELKQQEQEQHE